MIPPKRPKMMQVVSVKQNVSRMAKSVVALRRKVRATLYGLPEDQTTAAERKIVRDYPQYFENDRGYIKVKVTGKRRARNPKIFNHTFTQIVDKAKKLKKKSFAFPGELLADAHTYVMLHGGSITNRNGRLYYHTGSKNPYASKAQRRKFHAMAERGEISQAVVNEYDRKSEGLDLPKRINGSLISAFKSAIKDSYHKNLIKDSNNNLRNRSDWPNVYKGALKDFELYNSYADIKDVVSYGKALGYSDKVIITDLQRHYKHRKQNATADDFKSYQKVKLQDLVRKFQGHANGLKHRVLQSDLTPKNKYLLGCLALMKVKANGKIIPIEFSGAAYLAADLRNNLHAVGKDAIIENVKKPNPGQLKELGKLIQIDYITAKSHIENGETVRFWHKLGEVDAEHPTLFIDSDGFPIINGGGYDIWDVGIVN